MLDPRFRNLSLVSFVIGQKYVVPIVEEYDKTIHLSYAFDMLPYIPPHGKIWAHGKYAN
jgi:hypothetical protein